MEEELDLLSKLLDYFYYPYDDWYGKAERDWNGWYSI